MTFVCPTCTYPSRLDHGCDNPGCVDNITHAPEWRAELVKRRDAEFARRASDERARQERAHLREWARRNGATAQ